MQDQKYFSSQAGFYGLSFVVLKSPEVLNDILLLFLLLLLLLLFLDLKHVLHQVQVGQVHPSDISSIKHYRAISKRGKFLLPGKKTQTWRVEQFFRHNSSSFFFQVTLILTWVIDSPISPESWLMSLLFVVIITMVKQGYEDYLRSIIFLFH